MKRLVETLNEATGNSLPTVRLNKAFDLCYLDLEKSLNELRTMKVEQEDESEKTPNQNLDSNILEELLETARNTQRLLGNTDSKLYTNIEQVSKKTDEIATLVEKQLDVEMRRNSRKFNSMYVKEFVYEFHSSEDYERIFPYNILMMLSIFKEDFPWLYDAGSELVRTVESEATLEKKRHSLNKFRNVLEATYENPVARDLFRGRKDAYVLLRDMSIVIVNEVERYMETRHM